MKLILKNSKLKFIDESVAPTPTVYDTATFCGTSGLYKTDVTPLVLTASSNWGHSDFVPVSELVEVNVCCLTSSNCPGILYFSSNDISTYLGFESDTNASLGMVQFTSFNPPAGAQYALIQSYIGGGYYTPGSTITLMES